MRQNIILFCLILSLSSSDQLAWGIKSSAQAAPAGTIVDQPKAVSRVGLGFLANIKAKYLNGQVKKRLYAEALKENKGDTKKAAQAASLAYKKQKDDLVTLEKEIQKTAEAKYFETSREVAEKVIEQTPEIQQRHNIPDANREKLEKTLIQDVHLPRVLKEKAKVEIHSLRASLIAMEGNESPSSDQQELLSKLKSLHKGVEWQDKADQLNKKAMTLNATQHYLGPAIGNTKGYQAKEVERIRVNKQYETAQAKALEAFKVGQLNLDEETARIHSIVKNFSAASGTNATPNDTTSTGSTTAVKTDAGESSESTSSTGSATTGKPATGVTSETTSSTDSTTVGKTTSPESVRHVE